MPFFILNMLGGVVAAIWLAILGQWGAIGIGVAVMFGAHFAIAIAMMPQIALGMPSAWLLEKGYRVLGAIFALPALIYLYALITFWCGIVLQSSMARVSTEAMLIPMVLWSYAVATAPWTYMAQRENNIGSSTPIFFMELGYIVAGSMIVFGRSAFGDAMVVFAGIMVVAVIAQWAVVGVTAVKRPTVT